MTLYEIDKTIQDVIENGFSYDEETGEILFEASDLDALDNLRNEKIENIVLYVKNLSADIEAFDKELKAMDARKKACENKAARLKDYLGAALNGESFETARCKVSYRKSTTLEVVCEALVPNEYIVEQTVRKVDKMSIKNALKNGEQVEGVLLVEKSNIQIK